MSVEKQKTILLVEDEAIIAMTEKMTIEKYGYEVITANTAEAAVTTVEKTPGIDLILMDINLGKGIDGTEAAARILKDHDLPVVFLSSHTESEVVEKTEKITSYGYVVKNSSSTVLDASIKMAFKLFDARKKEMKKEMELAQSRDLLINLARLVPSVIYQYRLYADGRSAFPYSSPGMNDIYEVTPEEVREDATPVFGRLHPDDYDRVAGSIQESARTLQTFYCEFRVILPRQGLRWRWSQAHPERMADGGTLWHGIISDITERKQAEEELKKSQLLLKSSIESPKDMIILSIDKQYRYLYFNTFHKDVMAKAYGKNIALGMNLLECITHDDDRKKSKINYDRALAGENHTTIEEYGDLDRYSYETRYNPIINDQGEVIGATAFSTNVSQRKQAEAAITESENRYRTLFENISSGVAVYEAVDNGGDFIFKDFNPAAEKTEKVSRKDILGKRVSEVFPGVQAFGIFAVFQRVWRTGKAEYFPENIYKDKKNPGSWRENWVFKLPSGEIVAIYNDITERKRAEDALREGEEKWRKLVTTVPDYIAILDLKGRYTFLNHYAEGFSEKEAVGKNSADFVSKDSQDEYRRNFAACIQTMQTQHCIYTAWGDNMILKTYEGYFVPIIEKDLIINIMSIATDITENKRMEEDLRESEERFRGLYENSTIGIYRTTPAGKILMANPALVKMLGYSSFAEVASKNLEEDWFQPTYPRRQFIEKFTEQDEVLGLEASWKRRDGSTIFIREGSRAVRDANGAILYFDGTVEDITERKQTEEEIKRQLAEKEILLKEVHHRIKNNIAAIGALIALRLQSVSNPEAAAVLKEAIARVDSMRLLYDKLLLSEGYKDISVKNYLNDLIDTIIAIFPGSAKVKIEKQIADFHLDAKQLFPLGIIINELLTNKMKYAFVNKDSGLIRIFLKKKDGHVTLAIEDDGNGLPAGFDVNESKGFGLMLVKMLSQQLGGSFSIKRHEGTRCQVKFDI